MSNADDRPPCAECGDTWGAGVHDYAHPYKVPQPAPSGDEAKVREILDRTGWFFEVPRDKAQLVGHDEVLGLCFTKPTPPGRPTGRGRNGWR